jgi:cytochrome c peroxidase
MRRSLLARLLLPALSAVVLVCLAGGPARALEVFDTSEKVRAFLGLPGRYPVPKTPADNPLTREGVALGRFLFYDTRLSGNLTQSCSSCHQQALAFTDGRPLGVGSTGQVHPRNSMSLSSVGYASALAWGNPLLLQLEQQILLPMFGETPVELGLAGKEDELLARLNADPRYRRLFAEAFPPSEGMPASDPITVGNIVRAIASFTRTLISSDSPFDDYYYRFDDSALSPSALHGIDLFFTERLECFHCHGGTFFSASVTFVGKEIDEVQFDNNGLYNIDGQGAFPAHNRGIMEVTGDPRDMGRFKAPTLRNIALTGPYMHDGSMTTLESVLIDQYAHGGRLTTEGPNAGDGSTSPLKSPFVRGFTITDEEKQDILALLDSLTDERFVTNPRYSDPFPAPACAADCDLDEQVNAADVRAAVDTALGVATLAHCVPADADGDGEITVDELVAATRVALGGCSS